MGGFFGVAKHDECINELFYGVDYNSHMGTKRAGIATCSGGRSSWVRCLRRVSSFLVTGCTPPKKEPRID